MKTGIFIFGETLYVMQPDFMKVCFALVNCLLIISTRFFPWACLREGGGSQVGEITYGRSPNLTYERDHIKMRDYMERQVTPPQQVTSATWGPPPPRKQALRQNRSSETVKWDQFGF